MKKLLLVFAILASFAACGKKEEAAKENNGATVKDVITVETTGLKKVEDSAKAEAEAVNSEVKKINEENSKVDESAGGDSQEKPAEKTETVGGGETSTLIAPTTEKKAEEKTERKPEHALNRDKFYFVDTTNPVAVFDAASGGKRTDYLRRGSRVSILEEKVVGTEKPVTYTKVKYEKDRKTWTGWIPQKSLTTSLDKIIPEKWGKLNFEPFPKQEYPDNPKKTIKGIYVSTSTVSTPKALDRLLNFADTSEINAFVIDVKNDDGHLTWSMPEVVSKYGLDSDKRRPIKDIDALMKKLKEHNIYTIARIVSFKDPTYAKAKPERTILDKRSGKPFTNADGLIWVSAHDRELWQYNIDVAKAAAKAGFNEVQFDYVRFPASNGGKLDPSLNYRNTTGESKPAAIQKFLIEAHKQLSPLHVYTSADVYGQVGSSPDDMALGQHWEAVSNVVDFISPMVYPSHYANGMYGTNVPDAEPYKTVWGSTRDSLNRNNNIDTPAHIRTWIQDFTAPWVKGHIKYGEKEVREQIKALNDLGLKDYILWNAANRYSFEKKEAAPAPKAQ